MSPANSTFQRFVDSPHVEYVVGDWPVVYVPEITPEATVSHILRSARRAINDPSLHAFARMLVCKTIDKRTHPVLAAVSEANAVCDVLRYRIRYTKDPHNVELVFGAAAVMELWRVFGKWAEDCDGYADMALALLWSLGHHCQVALVGFDEWATGFDHVFVETEIPGYGLYVVDPTEDNPKYMTHQITYFERFDARCQ